MKTASKVLFVIAFIGSPLYPFPGIRNSVQTAFYMAGDWSYIRKRAIIGSQQLQWTEDP